MILADVEVILNCLSGTHWRMHICSRQSRHYARIAAIHRVPQRWAASVQELHRGYVARLYGTPVSAGTSLRRAILTLRLPARHPQRQHAV
jgi:hypothetical protein